MAGFRDLNRIVKQFFSDSEKNEEVVEEIIKDVKKEEPKKITRIVYFSPLLSDSEIVSILNMANNERRMKGVQMSGWLGFPLIVANMEFIDKQEHYDWMRKFGILKTESKEKKK